MNRERFIVGQWTIDSASSEIEHQGERRHIEPRLTELLCHFARHPRRVISKEELIEAVWPGRVLDATAVARAIAELRRALGDTAQAPRYIETIPKRGYRLIADVTVAGRRGRRGWLAAAAAIVIVLGVVLMSTRAQIVSDVFDLKKSPGGTSSEEARHAYEQAIEALEAGGQTGNETAVVHLTRALELDPRFALARARLSETYSIRATWYGVDGEWADAALAEASRAVALGPNLAETHRALGLALSAHGRFREALASYRRALELHPTDHAAIFRLGEALGYRGEWTAALTMLASIARQDELDGRVSCEIGSLLSDLGYGTDARTWFRAATAAEPFQDCANIRLSRYDLAAGDLESARSRVERLSSAIAACEACDQILGEIALREEHNEEAVARYTRALERAVPPKSTFIRIRLARLAGDTGALRSIATSLERDVASGVDVWFPTWLLSIASAELGDDAAALKWHAEARARGYLDWHWDTSDPAFASLRSDPEFRSEISKMKDRIEVMRKEIEAGGILDALRERARLAQAMP